MYPIDEFDEDEEECCECEEEEFEYKLEIAEYMSYSDADPGL